MLTAIMVPVVWPSLIAEWESFRRTPMQYRADLIEISEPAIVRPLQVRIPPCPSVSVLAMRNWLEDQEIEPEIELELIVGADGLKLDNAVFTFATVDHLIAFALAFGPANLQRAKKPH